MPRTLREDLIDCIDQLDLDRLRETIEANLGTDGRLINIDLNDIVPGVYNYNILGYLLKRYHQFLQNLPSDDEIDRIQNISDYLLMLRDNLGNLLFDINLTNSCGDNLVNLVVKAKLPIESKRYLLQSLLDVRGYDGELLINGDSDSEILKSAILLADPVILRAILDARTADGNFFLAPQRPLRLMDLNAVQYVQYSQYDDLGKRRAVMECLRSAYVDRNLPLQEIERAEAQIPIDEQERALRVQRTEENRRLQEEQRQREQAQRAEENRRLQEQRQREERQNNNLQQRPPEQNAEDAGRRAATRFDNDSQNTHDPSVTHTAKGTLRALNTRYKEALVEDQAVREIEELCDDFNYNSVMVSSALSFTQKKAAANEYLNLIKQRFSDVHSYTGFNYKRIIGLVWSGIIDDNIQAYPVDMHNNIQTVSGEINNLIALKKSSMVEKFIEATLTYRERGRNIEVCVGGGIHKILETLNRAHADVVIATGDQSVLPLANDMAISLVGAELLKKNPAEQSEILSTWNIDDSAGMQFKAAIVSVISQRLKDHFAVLLSSQQVNQITSTIEYIPRPPVPSRDLNQKVSEIENISPITQSQDKNALLEAFKRSAITIYFMDTTSEIKLVTLRQLEESFSLACSYIEDIANLLESDELSRNMQIAIGKFNEQKQVLVGSSNITEFEENYLLFSEAFDCCKQLELLELLEQQILSFPEDTENSFRNEAIQQLKALGLQDVSGRVDKSAEQIGRMVKALKNEYEDFLELDHFSQSLMNLRGNEAEKLGIRNVVVKLAARDSYENYATGRTSSRECYKNLSLKVSQAQSTEESFSLACSYVEDIANLLESDELSRNMQIAIGKFNEQKQVLVGSSNITEFEENYLLFSEAFDCCKQLEQLEQLEQQILSFPEDTENGFRNEAIQQLKALELQEVSGRVDKSAEQIGKIVKALKKKYEDFLKLDQLSCSLLDLRNSYSGSSETRIDAVKKIESYVNASLQAFATGGVSAQECYETLRTKVTSVQSCAYDDHKKHGAGRFFKSLQPESTLVKAIQSKINLKK